MSLLLLASPGGVSHHLPRHLIARLPPSRKMQVGNNRLFAAVFVFLRVFFGKNSESLSPNLAKAVLLDLAGILCATLTRQ